MALYNKKKRNICTKKTNQNSFWNEHGLSGHFEPNDTLWASAGNRRVKKVVLAVEEPARWADGRDIRFSINVSRFPFHYCFVNLEH